MENNGIASITHQNDALWQHDAGQQGGQTPHVAMEIESDEMVMWVWNDMKRNTMRRQTVCNTGFTPLSFLQQRFRYKQFSLCRLRQV